MAKVLTDEKSARKYMPEIHFISGGCIKMPLNLINFSRVCDSGWMPCLLYYKYDFRVSFSLYRRPPPPPSFASQNGNNNFSCVRACNIFYSMSTCVAGTGGNAANADKRKKLIRVHTHPTRLNILNVYNRNCARVE